MSGIALRKAALLNADSGRSVIVAFDHGIAGVPKGGESSHAMLKKLATSHADALLVGPGLMRQLSPLLGHPGAPRMVVTVDGLTFGNLPGFGMEPPLTQQRMLISVDEALRYGAVAAKLILPLGLGDAELSANSTQLLARTAEACDRSGLPVMIESAFWGAAVLGAVTDEMIAHAARVSIELGADILKIPAPSNIEVLRQIIDSTPVPVYLLGGVPTTGSLLSQSMVEWVDAGATGVIVGRNVWGRPQVDLAISALIAAVHDRDAAGAEELFAQSESDA